MLPSMKIGTRLASGFGALILFNIAIGVLAINSNGMLSEVTNDLYVHSFAVTNALEAAKGDILSLRSNAKDILLVKNASDVDAVAVRIDALDKHFLGQMTIVRERFLGDQKLVQDVINNYEAWRPIRENVLQLGRAGKRDEAEQIITLKGAGAANATMKSMETVKDAAGNEAVASMARAASTHQNIDLLTYVLMASAVLIGAGVAFVITRGIARPVNAMTAVMAALANNDLGVEVPFTGRGDEIGVMAQSVRHFKEQLSRVRQLEMDHTEQKQRAEADRQAAMDQMADTFEGSVGKVVDAVTSAATELQAASGQMAGTATHTGHQAATVASSAQLASANVQTVASATEELSASIGNILRQVEQSQAVAARAGEVASHTTIQVRALSDNVSKIGEIVNLINDIASQTNLLALNATIEAARAGDAGKGFAVVANEVKHLANQTAKATGDIASQIKAVQDGTDGAVRAIDTITKVIGEMGEISAAVAVAVQQQTAATSEIARNVEQAAVGTEEVSNNIVAVEHAAEETGDAAQQIRASSTDLSKQAEYLRHEVGRFLDLVRSDKTDGQGGAVFHRA